jgi:hypothetical protein
MQRGRIKSYSSFVVVLVLDWSGAALQLTRRIKIVLVLEKWG